MTTKIDWCDETWNCASGCNNNCPYCYARKIALRFPELYPNGFKPTFYPERYNKKLKKKPSTYFINSMFDIFNDCKYHTWVDAKYNADELWFSIVKKIKDNPQHFYLALSKNPIPFYALEKPDNLWLGFSMTKETKYTLNNDQIDQFDFFSCEPFDCLSIFGNSRILRTAKWIIVGCQTNPLVLPVVEQVEEIIEICQDNNIPVFVKEPLSKIHDIKYKQFPNELKKARSNE